jgi:type II secretion system protein G
MFSLKQRFSTKPAGFTILDVVVVAIVVGFFAVLIVPGLVSGPSRARDSSRKSDLRVIKSSLENYYTEKGSYPATLAELESGAVPFIKKLPKDPKSGNDYIYVVSGTPPSSFYLDAELENKNDKDLKTLGSDQAKGIYRVTSTN